MKDEQTKPSAAEEATVERLLRIAGPRPEPSAATRQAVYDEVRATWEAQSRRRRTRRRLLPVALAASLAALTAVWLWPASDVTPPAAVYASLDRGALDIASAEGWRAAVPAAPLRVGPVIRTRDAPAGLRLANGISLRMDRQTRLRFTSAGRAELQAGRVYVDTAGRVVRDAAVTIVSGAGIFRHVGTQYEIATTAERTALRVRDGIVILETEVAEYVAGRGEELVVPAAGAVERRAVASTGPGWNWTLAVAPHFDTDGRLVSELVAWAARETGRQVVYADALIRNAAAATRIRGSVTGQSPEEVLDAALATTRFTYHLEEAILSVDEHR